MCVHVRVQAHVSVWALQLTAGCRPLPRLFLLRDSQSNPKAFVLTLCHHQKIKNFQILPVSTCVATLILPFLTSWFCCVFIEFIGVTAGFILS